MINITDKEKCCGCGACVNVCPRRCIRMEYDGEGFLYPVADPDECSGCGLCESVCPFADGEKSGANDSPDALAVKAKDDGLRLESSSGGVFSLIASEIIKDGGCVFGAAFSDDFRNVVTEEAYGADGIAPLRRSKYVQCGTGLAFEKVKNLLTGGKKVLFTGTPCQVAGLKKYLAKPYDGLFCAEVICHGAPSPGVWQKYLDHLCEKFGGTVEEVNFRRKRTPESDFGTRKYKNCVEIFTPRKEDAYLQFFLDDLSLRPSCYSCVPKERGSCTDITLGDFWGINTLCPEMSDSKGVSLVIARTVAGKELIDRILDKTEFKEVAYDDAAKFNASMFRSAEKPESRDGFFECVAASGIDGAIGKYYIAPALSLKQKLMKAGPLKALRDAVKHDDKSARRMQYGLYVKIRKEPER